MTRSLGALPPEVRQAAERAMPDCYDERFDACLEDENRAAPECLRFEPVHAAYDVDHDATRELVDAVDYCGYSKRDMLVAAGVAGAVGLVLGAALGAL